MTPAPDDRRRRTSAIRRTLARLYPDAHCALDHETPLQLLIATILSAQCTDARVNLVTPALFTALDSGRRPRWCVQGTAPVIVTSVRVGEPVDGVAEVSAVARRAGKAHAVAARLEGIDGRWRCTALQVG